MLNDHFENPSKVLIPHDLSPFSLVEQGSHSGAFVCFVKSVVRLEIVNTLHLRAQNCAGRTRFSSPPELKPALPAKAPSPRTAQAPKDPDAPARAEEEGDFTIFAQSTTPGFTCQALIEDRTGMRPLLRTGIDPGSACPHLLSFLRVALAPRCACTTA